MMVRIALRNILRNRRRSLMTAGAVGIGAVAMLLPGAFFARSIIGFQTLTVQRSGHFSVFRTGYFDFGSGNPTAYSISGYQDVMTVIRQDPELGKLVRVVTPTIRAFGIAGNFTIDASRSFFGEGFLPSDRDRMRQWDEYGVVDGLWRAVQPLGSGLSDHDASAGVIGQGLARILGLCSSLGMANCPAFVPPGDAAGSDDTGSKRDFSDLIGHEPELAAASPEASGNRLDLLAATAGGAPNVVRLHVVRADFMGVKELDDSYVGMNLSLAQQLLYGRGEPKVTAIVLQLYRTEDMDRARQALVRLFREHALPLEPRDFRELTVLYGQAVNMYIAIFAFIGVIMLVIVLFTVVNTMSMSVMERVNEIGTLRALGLRRHGIRQQFLLEGFLLGAVGAAGGVLCAAAAGYLFNAAGLTWTPPMSGGRVPLQLMMRALWIMAPPTWLALIITATVAGLVPADRAARMPVVDALRHV